MKVSTTSLHRALLSICSPVYRSHSFAMFVFMFSNSPYIFTTTAPAPKSIHHPICWTTLWIAHAARMHNFVHALLTFAVFGILRVYYIYVRRTYVRGPQVIYVLVVHLGWFCWKQQTQSTQDNVEDKHHHNNNFGTIFVKNQKPHTVYRGMRWDDLQCVRIVISFTLRDPATALYIRPVDIYIYMFV